MRDVVEKYGFRYLCFMDDLFAFDVRRLEEIRDLVRHLLPLEITATVRADLATERSARILAEMGVKYAHVGLESGSEPVLQYLKSGTITVDRNRRALEILHKHGIRAIGSFIIGAPLETEEDLEATYRFIRENLASGCLSSFTFGPLVPFPGTAIWQDARRRGLIDEKNIDWTSLDIDIRFFDIDKYVLLAEKVSPERFRYWFSKFFDLYREANQGAFGSSGRGL